MKKSLPDTSTIKTVYNLYFLGFVTMFITSLMGYMMAKRALKKTTNELLENHYSFQLKIMRITFFINAIMTFIFMIIVFQAFSSFNIETLSLDDSVLAEISTFSTVYTLVSIASSLWLAFETYQGLKAINQNQLI